MFFFFSSRRRHTRYWRDWSSDVCSSDLLEEVRKSFRLPFYYRLLRYNKHNLNLEQAMSYFVRQFPYLQNSLHLVFRKDDTAECRLSVLLFLPGSKRDRKSTRLNSSHANISYAVFCLKKK